MPALRRWGHNPNLSLASTRSASSRTRTTATCSGKRGVERGTHDRLDRALALGLGLIRFVPSFIVVASVLLHDDRNSIGPETGGLFGGDGDPLPRERAGLGLDLATCIRLDLVARQIVVPEVQASRAWAPRYPLLYPECRFGLTDAA